MLSEKTDSSNQAITYISRGFAPIPLPSGSKNPARRGWQHERHGVEDVGRVFEAGGNIGLLLGDPSGGLVDIDLDAPEAVEAAHEFLPPTMMVQGRASRRFSHWFYRCPGAVYRQFTDANGKSLVELRSTGQQTVVVPSVHPSGESYIAEADGDPGEVGVEELNKAVALVASAAALARCWPGADSHQRHRFALALGAYLLDRGLSPDIAASLIERSARIAGDEEAADRVKTVESSAERGGKKTGLPTIEEILGESVTQKLMERLSGWLNLREVRVKAPKKASATPKTKDAAAPTRPLRSLPFPISAFPKRVREFVTGAADAIGCPRDFLGAGVLGAASCAIGNSSRIRLRNDWSESAALYVAIVAPPGSMKTPASNLALAPVNAFQSRLLAEYAEARTAHEREVSEFEQRLKDWRKSGSGEPPEEPDTPTAARVVTADSTCEALAQLLERNWRGILLCRDEIAGWARALNQYRGGRGADRQFFLSCWSNVPLVIDRKNQDSVHVPLPFLSVHGGCTPDMLSELSDQAGREDGFVDRILFAFPDEAPAASWPQRELSLMAKAGWDQVIQKLFQLPHSHDDDGNPQPILYPLEKEAAELFVEWYDSAAAELNDAALPWELRGPYSKLRGYAARLALVVQALRCAAGETSTGVVEAESVEGAVELVRYFKACAAKVYRHLRSDPLDGKVAAVVRWLQSRRDGAAPVRDLQRNGVASIRKASESHEIVREIEDRALGTREERDGVAWIRLTSGSCRVHVGYEE